MSNIPDDSGDMVLQNALDVSKADFSTMKSQTYLHEYHSKTHVLLGDSWVFHRIRNGDLKVSLLWQRRLRTRGDDFVAKFWHLLSAGESSHLNRRPLTIVTEFSSLLVVEQLIRQDLLVV